MPPMDMGNEEMPQDGGNETAQPLPNEMPSMNMGGDETGSEFDTNFDAGVDANEETEPKKYIQQLTGKLSQSLRKYNNEQQQPDAELSKYVCGMIVKQAIEGLDEKDTSEILKKIKSDEEPEEPADDGNDVGQEEEGGGQGMEQQPPMPVESINRKQKIDEIFQDLTSTDGKETHQEPDKRKSFKKKPYMSPNFK